MKNFAVETDTNIVVAVSYDIRYTSNGYPVLQEIEYPEEIFIFVTLEDAPEYIIPYKFCYTKEQGFYKNPDWDNPNPYGIPDELVERIKNDTIAQVQEGVINGKM